MTAKILTANRLADGGVVYLTADGTWSNDLQRAAVASTGQEAELTAQADEAVAACLVVEPYLIPVSAGNGRLVTASQRERIRAAGPTVAGGQPASFRAHTTETVHVSL